MSVRGITPVLIALAACVAGCGRTERNGDADVEALAPADTGLAAPTSRDAAETESKVAAPIVAQAPPTPENAPIPTFDGGPSGPVVSQIDLNAPPVEAPSPDADGDATDAPPAPTLAGGVTPGQVCAAAMGMLTGADPASVAVRSGDTPQPRVALVRPDGANQVFDCRIAGRSVLWRPVDATGFGRWRDDDAITFTTSERGLAMTAGGVTRAFARP